LPIIVDHSQDKVMEMVYSELNDPWEYQDLSLHKEYYTNYCNYINKYLTENRKIIDIGCGMGMLWTGFNNLDKSLHPEVIQGFEVSQSAITKGLLNPNRYERVCFNQCDVSDPEKLKQCLDLIGSVDVLHSSSMIFYIPAAKRRVMCDILAEHPCKVIILTTPRWSKDGDEIGFPRTRGYKEIDEMRLPNPHNPKADNLLTVVWSK
jgi:hypothetical protein